MLADAKPIRLTRAFGEAGKRVNGLSVEHWSRGRSPPTARRFLARKLASYCWFTRSMSPFLAEVERDSGTGISLLVARHDQAVLPLLGVLRVAPRLDVPVVTETNEVHLCGAKGVA